MLSHFFFCPNKTKLCRISIQLHQNKNKNYNRYSNIRRQDQRDQQEAKNTDHYVHKLISNNFQLHKKLEYFPKKISKESNPKSGQSIQIKSKTIAGYHPKQKMIYGPCIKPLPFCPNFVMNFRVSHKQTKIVLHEDYRCALV